jgi:hypothetical protein
VIIRRPDAASLGLFYFLPVALLNQIFFTLSLHLKTLLNKTRQPAFVTAQISHARTGTMATMMTARRLT